MTTPPSSGQTQHSRPCFSGTRKVRHTDSRSRMTDAVLQSIPCVRFAVSGEMHKTHRDRRVFILFIYFCSLESNLKTPSIFMCVFVTWISCCLCCVRESVPLFTCAVSSPQVHSQYTVKYTHLKGFPPGMSSMWLLLLFYFPPHPSTQNTHGSHCSKNIQSPVPRECLVRAGMDISLSTRFVVSLTCFEHFRAFNVSVWS